jgi:hypothetical protein
MSLSRWAIYRQIVGRSLLCVMGWRPSRNDARRLAMLVGQIHAHDET